jgi:hypothetical protein
MKECKNTNGILIERVGWLVMVLMDLLMEMVYKPSVEVHIRFLIFLFVYHYRSRLKGVFRS